MNRLAAVLSSAEAKMAEPCPSAVAVAVMEAEPLMKAVAECRICQEEDSIDGLEAPCGCSGSLKFAHRKCVQQWCNEKGGTTCEICHKPYEPDYTVSGPLPEEATIDISGWNAAMDLHEARIFAMAEAERHFFEAEYEGYADSSAGGTAFLRSVALILMALLLMRHALALTDPDRDEDDNDSSTFFSLFLLRISGFLLPCYIMCWAISIMQQHRRQAQQEAAESATHFAFVLHTDQTRDLQFAMATSPTAYHETV